ncbi:MAG: hypothetical protein ACP5UD_09880 [Conexivisphaera sp.]
MSLLSSLKSDVDEAVRQYMICNACRLCDNTCPVWPALSSKPLVSQGEAVLLANLCYDHRDCYYSCPYIEPHPFKVNIPAINRRLRLETYSRLTINLRSGLGKALFAMLFVPVLALWALFLPRIFSAGPINFYDVLPKDLIIASGLTVLVYLIGFVLYMLVRYNATVGNEYRPRLSALPRSITDWLRHMWMESMHYPYEGWSRARLIYHLLIFYGFALDLLATILGAIYEDMLNVPSPFPAANPTVILGLIGGAMLLAGTVMALVARYVSSRAQRFEQVGPVDVALASELLAVAVTGLLVFGFRIEGLAEATYLLLLIHLTFIYILFVTALHSSTLPHMILRPYSLWIYNSVVEPSPTKPKTHALVNLPGHKHVRDTASYYKRARR